MNYFNTRHLIDYAQQTADAISSVLNLQVTIVDSDVRRVAGTGCFSLTLDKVLSPNYVFNEVIRTGEKCLIENPGLTDTCRDCAERSGCKEKATLLVPVNLNGQVIGAIGIAAMNEDDKQRMIDHIADFTVFMEKMADMLAAKVESNLNMTKLSLFAKRFETVVSAFQDGILLVDAEGRLIHYNRQAELILSEELEEHMGLDIRDIVQCPFFDNALTTPMNVDHQKVSVRVQNRVYSLVMSVRTIVIEQRIEGFVAFFEEVGNSRKKMESVFLTQTRYSFDDIIGESAEIKDCIEMAKKVSKSNSSILILGESGTGKEMFARAIHRSSNRSRHNFVAINCSAIPDALLESELFGYKGGAFTGASKDGNPGKFEIANGGTVFLDEIGDMPLHLQAKLLRVLQEREVVRIGDSHPIPIDVRVIAATNRNLEDMISKNLFRRDLFYRINVIPISIPSLVERKEDIQVLAMFLLKKHAALTGKIIEGIEPDALRILEQHDWPGNVRELENVIEYAINMETEKRIQAENLPSYLSEESRSVFTQQEPKDMTLKEAINLKERDRIINALQLFEDSTNGKRECASYLGISLSTLYRKLKEYGIN